MQSITPKFYKVILSVTTLLCSIMAFPHKAQASEAYVVRNDQQKTLTFYYDNLRDTRQGKIRGINETQPYDDRLVPSWTAASNNGDTIITKVIIDPSFQNFRPTTTASWFDGFIALNSIEGMSNLNTAFVTDMRCMFSDCKSIKNIDLSHLDTRNVNDLSEMFANCRSLQSIDLSTFSTEKVTNMRAMFYYCQSLPSLKVSTFNTSNVYDMGYMFAGCKRLKNIDIRHFNTEKVIYFDYTFYGCSLLESLDLTYFNTAKARTMRSMFYGCQSLTKLDLSHFNTEKVTEMIGMFNKCISLTDVNLSSFNVKNVDQMGGMFYHCRSLKTLDLSHFVTEKATIMTSMFEGCTALTTLDLSHFITSNVYEMLRMFYDCPSLTTIYNNNKWECEQSKEMFKGCVSIKGATTFISNKTDAEMANAESGYFTAKTTGIASAPFSPAHQQTIYTLQGKRISHKAQHHSPGIYIINGRKVMMQ